MNKFLLFFMTIFAFISLKAQDPGDLDPEFANNGIATFAPTNSFDKPKALMVQPDGNIITVSEARVGNTNYHIVVSRHHANGSIDNSFGDNGMIMLHPFDGWRDNNPMDAMLLDNEKILIAGYLFDPGKTSFPFLIQLNPDGSFDEEFGIDGCRIYEFSHDAIARSMDIQSDGKILLVGQGQAPTDRTIILRCMPNGNLDSSFGEDGLAAIDIPGTLLADSDGNDVLALQDGKILVTADAPYADLGGQRKSVLFRLNEDGSLDTTFGENGVRWLLAGAGPDYLLDLQLVNDKIYVSGHSWKGQPPVSEQLWYDYIVARVNMDGAMDESYGNAGFASMRIKKKGNYHADFIVSKEEKVYGLINYEGYEAGEYISNIGLLSIDANGNPNQDFGDAGIVDLSIEDIEYKACEIAFAKDSALIVSGKLGEMNGNNTDCLIARYISDIEYDKVEDYAHNSTSLFNIYPNPAFDEITLIINDETQVYDLSIYNITGSLAMQTKVSSVSKIDINNLQNGVYIAEIKSGTKILTTRFIKQ